MVILNGNQPWLLSMTKPTMVTLNDNQPWLLSMTEPKMVTLTDIQPWLLSTIPNQDCFQCQLTRMTTNHACPSPLFYNLDHTISSLLLLLLRACSSAERGNPQRDGCLAFPRGAALEGEQAGGQDTAALEQDALATGPRYDGQRIARPYPGKLGRHDRATRALARVR